MGGGGGWVRRGGRNVVLLLFSAASLLEGLCTQSASSFYCKRSDHATSNWPGHLSTTCHLPLARKDTQSCQSHCLTLSTSQPPVATSHLHLTVRCRKDSKLFLECSCAPMAAFTGRASRSGFQQQPCGPVSRQLLSLPNLAG